MSSLQSLVAQVYALAGVAEDAASDRISRAQIVEMMNVTWGLLRATAVLYEPAWAMRATTLALTRDAAVRLPDALETLLDIEDAQGAPVDVLRRAGSAASQRGRAGVELIGRNAVARNLASQTVTLRYHGRLAKLHYGTCPDASGSALSLALDTSESTRVGELHAETDRYAGMRLVIASGPGAGSETFIESNTGGASPVVSVWPALSESPTAETTYGILPPWDAAGDAALAYDVLSQRNEEGLRLTPEQLKRHGQLMALCDAWARRQATQTLHVGKQVEAAINDWDG